MIHEFSHSENLIWQVYSGTRQEQAEHIRKNFTGAGRS